MDALIAKQYGQDVIDSLSVLEAVVPTLHEGLWPTLIQIFPMLNLALRSKYAIIRQSAARCFATVCDVMTPDAMRFVIEEAVPLLGDPLSLSNRQGAVELIYRKCCRSLTLLKPRPTLTYRRRYRAEAGLQGVAICAFHGRSYPR
jgi:hypothetical protein